MTEKRHIYLDNGATTKISKVALEKYIEVSEKCYGNHSSLHSFGLSAEKEVEKAKDIILKTLGAKDSSVVFTSSGSEANNLAVFGRASAKERYKRGAKIITTKGEHSSVISPIKRLCDMGFSVAEIPTSNGKIDIASLEKEMTPDVILVSMMMVNNETGALYDIKKVSEIMKKNSKESLLHIDATQSYMKVAFTKQSIGADMITVSSHKIEGPKGVGALIIDNKVLKNKGIAPLIFGGGQEYGLRSGTENVPAIASFGVAAENAFKNFRENTEKLESLRNRIIENILSSPSLSSIKITNPESHAPHIMNITVPGIKSETLLHYLSSLGIYVSSGSACSSNSRNHISSALTSYGISTEDADSSVRISLSHENSESDIDALCDGLSLGIARLARMK